MSFNTKAIHPPQAPYPWQSADACTEAEVQLKAQYEGYWRKKRVAADALGCDVDGHCSDQVRMPFIAVTASKVLAYWGYPEQIVSLDVGPEWERMLKEFCTVLGVNPPGKVGWYMVSVCAS